MAAEAGAWCVPVRPAARRGPGADVPWVCSQVEAIMATIVPNAEGWARSRLRSTGVCQTVRTCGESSCPALLIDFAHFVFARRTQDTSSNLMRRCSSPTTTHTRAPFTSSRRCRRTPSARAACAGRRRGRGRAGGREGTRMRRAEAAERERTPHRIHSIGYSTIGYCRARY